jgi:MYXO-CTERM domain-containing protein
LADGRILAASSSGLVQTTDGGCTWEGIAPYEKVNAPALIQDPNKPERLYLSTFGTGGLSALRVSEDSGITWQPLKTASDTEFVRSIRVAPHQPEHIYFSQLSFGNGASDYTVWHSSDSGKTWATAPIMITSDESDFDLLGICPTVPLYVVAKAEAANPMIDPERLMVSHDGGMTFTSPMKWHVLNAVSFSKDGKTLRVASDDGLFASTDGGVTFTQVGMAQYVDTLFENDDTLLVGGYWRGVASGMPGVGASTDGGATLSQWMNLTDVVHPLACDPSQRSAQLCAALWPDWEREILGIIDTGTAAAGSGPAANSGSAGNSAPAAGSGGAAATAPNAGTSATSGGSAGQAATTPPTAPEKSGCSIAEVGETESSGAAIVWALAFGLATLGRRRHQRRTRPITAPRTTTNPRPPPARQ